MTKRKDRRRELLKHDEFLSKMERAARYIQTNPKKISIWVGLVVVVLASLAGVLNYKKNQTDTDAATLFQAQNSFLRPIDDPFEDKQYKDEAEKNEAALIKLEEYLKTAKGKNRLQALIFKASCQMALGKTEDVETTYKEISQDSGAYGMMGLIGLGDLALSKKEYDKAIGFYRQLLDNPDKHLFEDLASFRVAKAYREKGDLKTAEIELEGLVQKYDALDEGQKPPVHQDAKALLDEIKAENKES